jgi:hypothetical protein
MTIPAQAGELIRGPRGEQVVKVMCEVIRSPIRGWGLCAQQN